MKKNYFLPPEWHEQGMVQLTWPHKGTDWAYMLDEVEDCFIRIAEQIALRTNLLVVANNVKHAEHIDKKLEGRVCEDNLIILVAPSNDTWARDHGGITVFDFENRSFATLDYRFNGWGDKFAWEKDNKITSTIFEDVISCDDFVLEGGSIEVDGMGSLMTTSTCLLNKNRNPHLTKRQIEKRLKDDLGVDQILWLDYGYLAGDDTDSHIDTLARFAPDNTILYVSCDCPLDRHYDQLNKMYQQLCKFRNFSGEKYTLSPLPLPSAIYDKNGNRLPATYANFLIINGAVLVPIYGVEEDSVALAQIKKAFHNRDIIPINCRALIQQHGSLHCVTMQYPKMI